MVPLLLLPFILFLFLISDLVGGQLTANADTAAHYCFAKYYFNNLLNGVFPLWEPFVYSGRPFLALINGGMLSPFINMVLLGVLLGFDYYHAYLIFLLGYFFLGSLGFFFLCRQILKNDTYAFLGYILLLFSGMGIMVFHQVYVVLIFVPSVWFFVFLLRFFQEFQGRDFLGAVLAGSVMMISYYPFYLLTVVLVVCTVYPVFYWNETGNIIKNTAIFIRRHKKTAIMASIGVLVVSAPLFLYKLRDTSAEIITPCRHISCSDSNLNVCLNNSQMTFKDVGFVGTLGERASLNESFNGPRRTAYLSDDCFYIPIFCFIVIFISSLCFIDRLRKMILWVWAVLLLISLGGVGPFHAFLFDHVFYFKYFRNFFFFVAYLIPLTIIFAMLQLKALLAQAATFNLVRTVGIGVLHIIFWNIAQFFGADFLSTQLTIVLSLVFFIFYYLWGRELRAVYIAALLFLSLVQPVHFYTQYVLNASALGFNMPFFSAHVNPDFQFQRSADNRSGHPAFRFRDFNFDAMLSMSDSSGSYYEIMPDSVPRGHFLLMKKMDENITLDYLRNKFYLYDNVRFYNSDDEIILDDLKRLMAQGIDLAYVYDDRALSAGQAAPEHNVELKARVIEGRQTDFWVDRFDANMVTVSYQLDKPKFLVYTDNFTSDWRARMDGQEVRVYRSNIAFKGVMLPEGKHQLTFRYEPLGGMWIYWMCAVFLAALTVAVLLMFLRYRSKISAITIGFASAQEETVPKERQNALYSSGIYYLVLTIVLLSLIDLDALIRIRRIQLVNESYLYKIMQSR